jgi:RHS repeat-associated protein
MTDLTGTKAWEAETDSFGQVEITLSGIENNIRLAGQYFDSETGLHYNWNRYYDPTTGRYISQDPIGFAGGISLYGYVGQNPIGGIDPTGLWIGLAFKAAKFVLTNKYVQRATFGYALSRTFKPNAKPLERFGDVCITMASMGFASYWSKIPSGWIANVLGGIVFSFASTGNQLLNNLEKYKYRAGGLLEVTIKMITDGSKGSVINILTMITVGTVISTPAPSEFINALWGENTGFSDESLWLMSGGIVKSKVFWDENIGGSSKSITNIVDDESLSPKNRKFLNNLKKLKSEVFF